MTDTNKMAARDGAAEESTVDTSSCDYSVSGSDKLTVLETVGPCLTKIYKSDGTTDPYDDAASFHYKVVEVSDIHGLSRLLGKLHKNKKRCLIAGAPKGEGMEAGNVEGSVTRTNANFIDQPLHSFVIDIDGYRPGFAEALTDTENAVLDFFHDAKLDDAFKTCSFYWHLSSSAGMPGKEGILKCHVWLWSKTAYTCAQFTEWAKSIGPAVDRAVYRRVQIRYTADPIFEAGRLDPVPVRCGFHQGETDYVDLIIDQATLDKAREQGSGEGGRDMAIETLPSDKDGLIGAFHKAFTAEDVLLNFLEGFEQVTERRYTWLDGGGTPEGVWVHDSGEMIGSSHNTWPIDGRANLWDVVRVFKFGDLDHREGEEEDFETLGERQVGSRPSDLAMKAWAAGLDEVKKELAAEALEEQESRSEIVANLIQRIAAAETQFKLTAEVLPAIKSAMAENGFLPYEMVELENTFSKRFTALSPSKAKLGVKALREMFVPEEEETTRIFDLEMGLVKQVLGDWFGAGKHLKFFGGCWWIYRHGVWQMTEASLVENRVQRSIQRILAGDDKDARQLTVLLRESERGDYLNALTSAVCGNLRRHCSRDDLASDPLNLRGRPESVINCKNGELWFDDEGNVDFVAHDPAHKLTHQITTDYDPAADCPKFKAALALAFCKCSHPEDVIRHFLELMGTIIQPRRIEAMWALLKGGGENGKTFLVEIVEATMGSDSCLKGSVAEAAAGKDGHFTASLIGKLAFIDDDVKQGALLPDDWLKKLSEEKTLTANPKNASTFQFTSRATMVMLANHWPRTVDTSHGMTRRAHVFEFKHKLTEAEKNPGLKRYIIDNELPGVLNLLIEGWQRVLKRGRYERPAEVVAAGDRWMRSANTTGNFFKQMLLLKPKAVALKLTTVEQFYHSWMAEYEPRATPLGKQAFIAALQNMGVEVFTQHNQHHLRGVEINPVPCNDVPADYIADGVAEKKAEEAATKLHAKIFGTSYSADQDFAD